MSKSWLHVAVGVIVNQQHQVLIAKRAAHQHQGGLWEFPGGKLEDGEEVSLALSRELKEELDIDVLDLEPLIEIRHEYHDKAVLLDTWKVTAFSGEPKGLEGQPIKWVNIAELDKYAFPEANQEIITALLLA